MVFSLALNFLYSACLLSCTPGQKNNKTKQCDFKIQDFSAILQFQSHVTTRNNRKFILSKFPKISLQIRLNFRVEELLWHFLKISWVSFCPLKRSKVSSKVPGNSKITIFLRDSTESCVNFTLALNLGHIQVIKDAFLHKIRLPCQTQ